MESGFAGAREGLAISAGSGIELRPVHEDQAEALYELIDRNRARLREWLPWMEGPYGFEDLISFIRKQERERVAGTSLATAIFAGGEICGTISLHAIDRQHQSTAVGYWLDAEREGRGIMTAACRTIVTAGFQHYGLHRIEILCATANAKSSAIPQRLGFVEDGVLRQAQRIQDRWLDLRVFSMLKPDWQRLSGESGALR